MAKQEKELEKQNLDVIQSEELKKEIEELKKENEKLEAEKDELILERESVKIQKANVEKELEKQKSSQVLSKELDKKDLADAYKTAELLKKETIKIKIPIDKQNPKDLMVPVTINGYTWTIKRGETVVVPEAVANILETAGYL